jgi:hypothetical protein
MFGPGFPSYVNYKPTGNPVVMAKKHNFAPQAIEFLAHDRKSFFVGFAE